MKGASITVRCECGELRYVPYGERWQCEQCGLRWNTAQIEADEYWGIAGVFALLALLVSQTLFLLMPIVLAAWFLWYMPWWRRKVRRRARSLPKWKLRPE
jgi:Flp pilus assembly protein TadB